MDDLFGDVGEVLEETDLGEVAAPVHPMLLSPSSSASGYTRNAGHSGSPLSASFLSTTNSSSSHVPAQSKLTVADEHSSASSASSSSSTSSLSTTSKANKILATTKQRATHSASTSSTSTSSTAAVTVGSSPPEEQIGGLWRALNAVWGMVVGPERTHSSNGNSPLKPQRGASRRRQLPSLPRPPVIATLENTSWISAVVLGCWDNIFGPRLLRVWNGVEQLSHEALLSVARNTLSGDVADHESSLRSAEENDTTSKSVDPPQHVFLVLSSQSLVISATKFIAPHNEQKTHFVLAVLTRRPRLSRVLAIQSVIEEHLLQLVSKARILLVSKPQELKEALDCFASLLPEVAEQLDSVYFSGLPDIAAFDTTVFASELPLFSPSSSSSSASASGTGSSDSHRSTLTFLARAITSHLHTQGCTTVLGRSALNVNGFVESLALLLSDRDRARSSLVVANRPYVSDLILQGVLARSVSPAQLIRSQLPTTVVDLETLTVQHTHPLNEYLTLRREYLAYQIDLLSASPSTADGVPSLSSTFSSSSSSAHPGGVTSNGPSQGRTNVHTPDAASTAVQSLSAPFSAIPVASTLASSSSSAVHSSSSNDAFATSFSPRDFARLGMLRVVKSAAPCVEQMVREVFHLPVHLRQGFVIAFYRLVIHRAITLTKFVEAERRRDGRLDISAVKKIRAVLDIPSDVEFAMLLGVAEKFTPGIYMMVTGDPRSIESKFAELFEEPA